MQIKRIQSRLVVLEQGLIACCFLLGSFLPVQAQIWLGGEGSVGVSYNGGEPIHSLQLSGRLHVTNYLSTNLGIGLWNTGIKETWKVDNEANNTFTLHRLRESKAMPTLHLGIRGNMPVLKVKQLPISLFIEPSLLYLPFSAKTPTMEEVYYTYDPIGSAAQGKDVYLPTGGSQNFTLTSGSMPKWYYGLQVGFSTELKNQMYLGLGIGYSNLDLFNSLRNQTLHGVSLNNHLPRKGLTTLSLTLSYSVPAK